MEPTTYVISEQITLPRINNPLLCWDDDTIPLMKMIYMCVFKLNRADQDFYQCLD